MTVKTAQKPKRPMRRVLPYVGGILLVGLIVAGLWPQPVPVEMTPVTVGSLQSSVNEEGKTRIKNRYSVAAPVAGHLRRISLKAGTPVSGGKTVVAIIDPITPSILDERTRAQAEARRDAAAASVEKARVNHDLAARELKRSQSLFAAQSISIQEFELVQGRESAAAKDLSAAQSSLRQAEAELVEPSGVRQEGPGGRSVEVLAPVDGRVLRLFEESSRVIPAGTPLLEVGDPADLEAVIEVLSRDGAVITSGTRVELEQWGGTVPLAARVRLVEPAGFTKISALGVEEQRVNVVADLVTPVEQRGNLGDNFRVEARIITWETNQVLKVPSGALFRRGNEWAAYVVRDGKAHLQPVKAGRSSGRETEVIDGLKQGEQVILYPGDRVKEGLRIRSITISAVQ